MSNMIGCYFGCAHLYVVIGLKIIVPSLTTTENTITYHNALCLSPQNFAKHCFQFLLGPFELPRETEDNVYAKSWCDKQRALWYVMVFSLVVSCELLARVPALGLRRWLIRCILRAHWST